MESLHLLLTTKPYVVAGGVAVALFVLYLYSKVTMRRQSDDVKRQIRINEEIRRRDFYDAG